MKRIGVGDFHVTPLMKEYVNDVLESGRISYGPYSKEFERQFATMHGVDYGVLSNSGTSSLQVALQALKEIHGWDDDAEVIVPSVTFVATLNIVLHNNMVPVVVDVDPRTYNMDCCLIEEAITPNTKCIIPVHLFGQPANMKEIVRIASKHGLKVIEDSCECMYALHFGESVGSWGDIACFSTYVAHIITTGVGGIAITDTPEYAAKMRSLVNHGRDGIYISIDDDASHSQEIVERRFRFESIGHSFRITELEAALGLAQLEELDENILKRNINAIRLKRYLSDLQEKELIKLPYQAAGNTHSYMMFPIMTINEDKWDLVNYLEERGVETREMLPLINQPVYKKAWPEWKYPVAQEINRCGFYVGCHPGLEDQDMLYIADCIKEYYSERP